MHAVFTSSSQCSPNIFISLAINTVEMRLVAANNIAVPVKTEYYTAGSDGTRLGKPTSKTCHWENGTS